MASKRKCEKPYYQHAWMYFQKKARLEIEAFHPDWTREETNGTIFWLWNHPTIDKTPYQTAVGARLNKNDVDEGISWNMQVPSEPKTKDDAYTATPTVSSAAEPEQPSGSNGHSNYYPIWPPTLKDEDAGDETAVEYFLKVKPREGNEPDGHWWSVLRDSNLFPQNLKDRLGRGQSWRHICEIGEGGYGVVGLAGRINSKGKILELIAVKETLSSHDYAEGPILDYHFHQRWRDPLYWINRIPREPALMLRLRAFSDHFLYLHDWRVIMRQRRINMFMDVADRGDLQDVIDHFRHEAKKPIPERFIWHVLRDLVAAAKILDRGTLSGPRVPGWKPIYHFDIKPGNILLKTIEGQKWPRAILADFGLAVQERDFDNPDAGPEGENPGEFINQGSRAICPPETKTRFYIHHNTPINEDRKIGNEATVWGIGATLWYLMVENPGSWAYGPKYDWDDLQSLINDGPKGRVERILQGDVHTGPRNYSSTLRRLARGMLQYEPDDRVRLEEVDEQVTRWFDEHPLKKGRKLPDVKFRELPYHVGDVLKD